MHRRVPFSLTKGRWNHSLRLIVVPTHRCPSMKNVYEVLRQKELELTRLEKEVEALRIAAPLLSEEKELPAEVPKPSLTTTAPPQPVRIPPVVAAQGAPSAARVAGW